MKRYNVDGGIPTLKLALSEFMNSDDLKKLAALTKEKLPTRKADLAAVIMRHLDGERLRTVWQCLDELQRAAVAEVVHSMPIRLTHPSHQALTRAWRKPLLGRPGRRRRPPAAVARCVNRIGIVHSSSTEFLTERFDAKVDSTFRGLFALAG